MTIGRQWFEQWENNRIGVLVSSMHPRHLFWAIIYIYNIGAWTLSAYSMAKHAWQQTMALSSRCSILKLCNMIQAPVIATSSYVSYATNRFTEKKNEKTWILVGFTNVKWELVDTVLVNLHFILYIPLYILPPSIRQSLSLAALDPRYDGDDCDCPLKHAPTMCIYRPIYSTSPYYETLCPDSQCYRPIARERAAKMLKKQSPAPWFSYPNNFISYLFIYVPLCNLYLLD